jgi:hypothetical protein
MCMSSELDDLTEFDLFSNSSEDDIMYKCPAQNLSCRFSMREADEPAYQIMGIPKIEGCLSGTTGQEVVKVVETPLSKEFVEAHRGPNGLFRLWERESLLDLILPNCSPRP